MAAVTRAESGRHEAREVVGSVGQRSSAGRTHSPHASSFLGPPPKKLPVLCYLRAYSLTCTHTYYIESSDEGSGVLEEFEFITDI